MTNRLVIERGPSTNVGTLGKAEFVNPAGIVLWAGVDIELPWRDNRPMISCVPDGVYQASIVFFGAMNMNVYELQNVPGRTDCLVHPANWAGDEALGFHTDLHGCTGLGEGVGVLAPPGMAPQAAITGSVDAIKAFMAAAGGQDIEIEYRWTPGNAPAGQS